ncbi:MAG TPA: hypothetical protein P5230_03310 [Candidatus Magasanikbacteria bacterium]|nr:hypothetical protein [Candidatus Magasanikbacteria bacterium]
MNLTLRARIFIIISIVVLLILAISVGLIVFSKQRNTDSGENTQNNQEQTVGGQTDTAIVANGTVPTAIGINPAVSPLSEEEKIKSAAQSIAKIFIERYGSYSTDNPGQNLKELESLSTKDLWNVFAKRIEGMNTGKEFIGVTTEAFSVTVTEITAEKATIRAITSREENNGGVVKNYNQEAEISLVRNGEGWLVDNVKWK